MYNLYLIFIIINLGCLKIILELNHIYTYYQIFINHQTISDSQFKVDLMLADLCKHRNKNLKSLGFIADEFSNFNQDGFNVYKINIDNFYGYVGCRGHQLIDRKLLSMQEEHYQKILATKGFKGEHLTMISMKSDQIDQMFFLTDTKELWRYEVAAAKFHLEYVPTKLNTEIINYKVAKNIIQRANLVAYNAINYAIYLHLKQHDFKMNSARDIIQVLLDQHNVANHSKLLIELVNSEQPILDFFIRKDHIIIVYQDLKLLPKVYKINELHPVKNYFAIQNLSSNLEISWQRDQVVKQLACELNDQSKLVAELLWDQDLSMHRLEISNECSLVSYLFNLKGDNYLLGSRIDYN